LALATRQAYRWAAVVGDRRHDPGAAAVRALASLSTMEDRFPSSGTAPDRFLVGLGVLSLVSEVAEKRPLLCVIDDAQWLDQASAQTLAFVARRLLAEPVGLVFAAREPGEELRHLPDLEVHGLLNGDARALLGSTLRFALDVRVRDRILAETRGNPLALLELPRGLTPTQLAGGFGMPEAPDLSNGSRRATSDDSRASPRTRDVCCSSQRPTRSAIRCCCSALANASGSRSLRLTRRTDCWHSKNA
jgi:hypothetical protein